jgi:hypothetical protein
VADVGSGVAEVQYRLLPGGSWAGTEGNEEDGWILNLQAPIDDQEAGEFTLELRAVDAAGNETPSDGYYTRAIAFDLRHPRGVDYRITRASSGDGEAAGLHDGPPEDLGPPLMGEPYLIALQVENPSPTEQSFTLEWREEGFGDVRVDWGLNMEDAETFEATQFSIPGNTTRWVWMPFQHSWSWIPEKDWVDLVLILIDAYDGDAETNEFVEWAHARKHLVAKVNWTSVRGDATENLSPMPQEILTEIKVADGKKDKFHSAYLSYCYGSMATAVGLPLLGLPLPGSAVGAALLVTQAAFLVASHVSYVAAYDPSPHYRETVQVQEIRVPELEELDRDDPIRQGAEASLRLAAHAQAASEAYIRYLGAVEAGDERAAQARAGEAASFATEAARQVEATAPLTEVMVDRIQNTDREGLAAMINWGDRFQVPEMEERIFRAFGLSPKDYEPLVEPRPDLLKKLLSAPERLELAQRALADTLADFADAMERAAAGRQ